MKNNQDAILASTITALIAAVHGDGCAIEAVKRGQEALAMLRWTEPAPSDELAMHKADSDRAKIVKGAQLVALVVRAASGRWSLCDPQGHRLDKIEYSTPKKAFAAYQDQEVSK